MRSFVNIPLSVKYNKTLKALATVVLFVWKYTALGESHITNTPLSFAFCYVYLPLNSHFKLYISYKLAAVLTNLVATIF